RRSPGLRALVQAADPRAPLPAADARGRKRRTRLLDLQAPADDPQARRPATRRDRDDDARPVPVLPRASRVLVRLPVRAVPRAGGDPRPSRSWRADRLPRAQPRLREGQGGAAAAVRPRLLPSLPRRAAPPPSPR